MNAQLSVFSLTLKKARSVDLLTSWTVKINVILKLLHINKESKFVNPKILGKQAAILGADSQGSAQIACEEVK